METKRTKQAMPTATEWREISRKLKQNALDGDSLAAFSLIVFGQQIKQAQGSRVDER